MEENSTNMPVRKDKRQEVETFPQMSHTQRPPSGEASAGDVSLQALWPLFVKIQPSLSSLLQDLIEWHASKLLQGPSSKIPQEISSDAGEPSCKIPKETHSDAEKPSVNMPRVIGSNAEEPSLSIPQENTEPSFDIRQEIGSDAMEPNSNVPQETCSDTKNPSRDIPQEIGLEAEKARLGQTSLGPNMHQEIDLGGTTSQEVSLQIDDEERSSIETYERKEKTPLHERVCLLKAALIGDWPAAKSILQNYPDAVRTPITKEGETALHIAVAGNHTTFAKELMNLMKPEDLMLKEERGETAFFYAAASGNVDCAKEMVKINNELPLISSNIDALPILMAIQMSQRNMGSYLLSVTPSERLTFAQRVDLLLYPIFNDKYDIALEIMRNYPKLESTIDAWGMLVLKLLAERPLAFGGTREQSHWKIGFKGAYHKAQTQTSAYQLVEDLWKQIQKLPEEQFLDLVDKQLIIFHTAAKLGNIEFLTIILCSYPELIWRVDENKQNLLQIAVLNRQESIFNLIYEIGGQKDFIVARNDANGNSMLHLVGQLAPSNRLNMIVGAALQMQWELLWFKEIEKIVPPVLANMENSKGKKAHDIFIEAHKDLRKEGEEWMKSTANSCMIVATLIATVVFAASFTIPGGNNQQSGTPIFLESNWFLLFFISNAIALLSSSTSVLIFLSILTSRFKEEDFLKSLPGRLVFGLTMLFISIVGMVLAFSATCFLLYQSKMRRTPIIIMALASLPVILFLRLHYALWFDIIRTTY